MHSSLFAAKGVFKHQCCQSKTLLSSTESVELLEFEGSLDLGSKLIDSTQLPVICSFSVHSGTTGCSPTPANPVTV